MGSKTFGWVLSLVVLGTLVVSGAALANEWQPAASQGNEWSPQGQNADQPWAVADPSAPAAEMLQPLHRRLPRFFLSSSVSYSPEPLLVNGNSSGGSCCGTHMADLAGAEINFDFRFWYFFIGSHMGVYGNDGDGELREYAFRAGFLIPFGERFAIVGTGWMGTASWDSPVTLYETSELPVGTRPSDGYYDYDSYGQDTGFLAGASIGVRVMIATWFGVTADTSLSTVIFSPGLDEYRLNRFQVNSGVVFAW